VEFKVNLQTNRLWSQYTEFGGGPRPPHSDAYSAKAWINHPRFKAGTAVADTELNSQMARSISPPVAARQTPSAVPIGPSHSPLSAKIREAMSADPDPAKSLADIRAILVGPTNRLHEARIEEIITILEETDQAAQMALAKLEKRCTELAQICQRLVGASEEIFEKSKEQKNYFEQELKTFSDKQDVKQTELLENINSRFLNCKTEISDQIEMLVEKATRDLDRLSDELADRIREQNNIHGTNFERLAMQFETKYMRQQADLEKEQKRNADVFAQGISDIAERLSVLRDEQTH
jgi:hypothetical protein